LLNKLYKETSKPYKETSKPYKETSKPYKETSKQFEEINKKQITMKQIITILIILFSATTFAQNVGIGTLTPDASAQLHISSTTKGLIIPRMTSAEKLLIAAPADGLMVYDTDIKNFWYYDNAAATWKELNSLNVLPVGLTNNTLRHDGTSWVTDNYVTNTGSKVGIGITAPTEGLHIDSSVKIGNSVWFSSANTRLLKFGDANFITMGEDSSDDRLYLRAKDYVFGKSSSGYTGNVGIGVTGTPAAKLEVNGSFKLTNGSQAAGKVLTSDASGNASWQEAPCMQHKIIFGTAISGATFTVPAGVTRLFIEVWSGGGSGSLYTATASLQVNGGGGGSGGYANFFLDVTPGATVTYNVGSVASGFNSGISYGGNTISINNGFNADNITGAGFGATLLTNSFTNVFFTKGTMGNFNVNTVYTIGATTYTEYRGGKGGDAPNGGAGGLGEIARSGYNSLSDKGSFPGGGGGAATSNGTSVNTGATGAVIIRY
jgi:hypothetical protein